MTTHFGFKTVGEAQKQQLVGEVFHSVAQKYDVMNDVMSLGVHRIWKKFALLMSGVRKGMKVLDVAGGSGDLSRQFLEQVGSTGEVWLTDINPAMLQVGRDRLLNQGYITPVALCNAEQLPYPDDYFDIVTVSFGLRNMTHKDRALAEMRRVIKPGGKVMVLEFSTIWQPLSKLYDAYSLHLLPQLGRMIAKDAESYRYLAESIRMHPNQNTLANMMMEAGLSDVKWFNLSAGIVALHIGTKYD
jgi:demethylmenaquinone methyltransferase/2-methoxy-6-polyprenyl-1,4-benzoquinol methylase